LIIKALLSLTAQLLSLFRAVGTTLKELNTGSRYLMDSFPVAVCDNIRIKRSRLLDGQAYRGYVASKRRYCGVTFTGSACKSSPLTTVCPLIFMVMPVRSWM